MAKNNPGSRTRYPINTPKPATTPGSKRITRTPGGTAFSRSKSGTSSPHYSQRMPGKGGSRGC